MIISLKAATQILFFGSFLNIIIIIIKNLATKLTAFCGSYKANVLVFNLYVLKLLYML